VNFEQQQAVFFQSASRSLSTPQKRLPKVVAICRIVFLFGEREILALALLLWFVKTRFSAL